MIKIGFIAHLDRKVHIQSTIWTHIFSSKFWALSSNIVLIYL